MSGVAGFKQVSLRCGEKAFFFFFEGCLSDARPFRQAVQRVAASGDHATGLTADSAGPEAARRSADADEVGRVLCALTDADALGLPPNPAPEAVKRAYRALAKRLHPDKCTAARATDAFQRIAKAYQRLGAVH